MSQRKSNSMVAECIVSRDPEVLSGAPVFAGTRVPVRALIDHLAEGDSIDDFLDGFPSVESEQAANFLRRIGEMVEAGELTV